jgi:hypothetical protein
MIDLNDIMIFARVTEAGSFTAAARLLGMPKRRSAAVSPRSSANSACGCCSARPAAST